jgi:hypothetical protein
MINTLEIESESATSDSSDIIQQLPEPSSKKLTHVHYSQAPNRFLSIDFTFETFRSLSDFAFSVNSQLQNAHDHHYDVNQQNESLQKFLYVLNHEQFLSFC